MSSNGNEKHPRLTMVGEGIREIAVLFLVFGNLDKGIHDTLHWRWFLCVTAISVLGFWMGTEITLFARRK